MRNVPRVDLVFISIRLMLTRAVCAEYVERKQIYILRRRRRKNSLFIPSLGEQRVKLDVIMIASRKRRLFQGYLKRDNFIDIDCQSGDGGGHHARREGVKGRKKKKSATMV